MDDHLSKAELDALSNGGFRGTGLFEALKHLEACERCRAQMKPPTKEEILKRFEDDEPFPSPIASALSPASTASTCKK